MAHALLLVLMGALLADELGLGHSVSEVGNAKPVASARASTATPFQVAPLVFGNPLGLVPFQPFVLNQEPPGTSSTGDQIGQLQNKRTGVTCTMRIIKVPPTFDRGILAPTSAPDIDPIVRNSLSPCVE